MDDNAHNLVRVGKKNKTNNNCMLRCNLLTQFDLERKWSWKIVHHSCFIQTEMKRSGSYLVVNTHTLGPVHLRRGWGGSLLACNRNSFWCDSLYGFACWSTPEMIWSSRSFHLLLDPVYRASPASHTKRSVSASTWHWWLYFSPVLGKHLPVIKKTAFTSLAEALYTITLSVCIICMCVCIHVCVCVCVHVYKMYTIMLIQMLNK